MTRRALVLRPEPGSSATAARLAAAGVPAVAVPLFRVVPVAWSRPAGPFDALLLTSANAVRHGGLDAVSDLPVVAVGAATAAAARAAGFDVVATGNADAAAAVRAAGGRRLLHLAGRDRADVAGVTAMTVYASEATTPAPGALDVALDGVVLLHSARAAARFAALSTVPRARVRLAAISAAVAAAAGGGWAGVEAAVQPSDTALVALAASLAIDR